MAVSCIWILYQNGTKEDVYQYAKKCYPEIDQYQMDKVRHQEVVSVDCMTCVPLAIQCFLESDDIESCIRNVLSFTGDTDTIGAIACSIVASYYGIDTLHEEYKKIIMKKYEEICKTIEEHG